MWNTSEMQLHSQVFAWNLNILSTINGFCDVLSVTVLYFLFSALTYIYIFFLSIFLFLIFT